MDTKIGAYSGYNPPPVTETPPVKTGNAWGAGTTGGTGLNSYGNITIDDGLTARLNAIGARDRRPVCNYVSLDILG